ncbi:MAG TPA: hypothetical protein VHE35_19100 [Kofleriaceae bacterium]|nr:hypothetical protein [Kofleriaceae bacterium]
MGNPECAEAGRALGLDLGNFELQVKPGSPGAYALDAQNTVAFTSEDQEYLDWTASVGMDAVLVTGGDSTRVYTYVPEARAGAHLAAPMNPKLHEPYLISAVTFCYDHELVVEPSTETALTRTIAWTVDLRPARTTLSMGRGETKDLTFTAVVARAGGTDSDWSVSGAIPIENPAPYTARVLAVEDWVGKLPATVVCPRAVPFDLEPFGEITCWYDRTLTSGATTTDRVVVKTAGYEVETGIGSATVDFAGAKVTERDGRVDVWDYRAGRVGTTDRDRSFSYRLTLGPYGVAGRTESFFDLVQLIGLDSGHQLAQDTATVTVTVTGCN